MLEEIRIENIIYEIRGKQVMLDSDLAITKCHNYFYYMIIVHYDISELLLAFDNYIII